MVSIIEPDSLRDNYLNAGKSIVILDVRRPEEVQQFGTIPTAKNTPCIRLQLSVGVTP